MEQFVRAAGGDAAALLTELADTLRAEPADMPSPEEDLRPMNRMVLLLDLADRASTDGDRDPRLDSGLADLRSGAAPA